MIEGRCISKWANNLAARLTPQNPNRGALFTFSPYYTSTYSNMKRPHTPETDESIKKYKSQKYLDTQITTVKNLRKQGCNRGQIRRATGISSTTQRSVENSNTLRREPRVHHRRKSIDDNTVWKMIKALHGSYYHRTWS